MKRITLENLQKRIKTDSYQELYAKILSLVEEEKIKPLKASGLNGKKPALYKEYWEQEQKEEIPDYTEELSYQISPMLSTEYYFRHPAQYAKDREWVLLLNDYLRTKRSALKQPKSLNERSFEIWYREKFLKEEAGRRILKNCGLLPEQLNIYETTEPLAYYVHTRKVPQNLLILENKDTFYSMRKHLLDGADSIFGQNVGTVIYGAGKGIYRSFQDFSLCAEPYMKEKENRIYYLGDIDYEGILIYETLAGQYAEDVQVQPFVEGYLAMLKKAKKAGMERMPAMKEGQNQKAGALFFSYFAEEDRKELQNLLQSGLYIPQEILSGEDF